MTTTENIRGARGTALALLARNAMSAARLCGKLRDKGYATEDVEEACAYCLERGYLDDRALAQRAAEKWMRKGYAGAVLEARIRALGVDRETARAAREESELARADGGGEQIDRLLEKIHKPGRPWDAAERRRCLAALGRRGIDAETAYAALDRRTNAENEEL